MSVSRMATNAEAKLAGNTLDDRRDWFEKSAREEEVQTVPGQTPTQGEANARAESESLMSIPMTGPVHPLNRSTNRSRRWLLLGLLIAFVATCATREHIRNRAFSLAGLTDVRRPSPRADESLAARGRSAQVERRSDSGVAVAALNPARADAEPIESRVALKPVAGASRQRLS